MLYQRVIRPTVPQRIRHKDPQAAADHDHLKNHMTQSAANHEHHYKPKSLLYAGQTVSILNDAKTLWLLATVIHQASHGSYLVRVIGGGQYRHAHDHIHKYHPDVVKPDTSTITDVAPATPECSPGMPLVRPAPAAPVTALVAQATTPQNLDGPATTSNTPRKSVVHTSETPSTGDVLTKTDAAPAALNQSASVRKPPFWFLEEMWLGIKPEDVPDVMLTQTVPGWWTVNIMAEEHYKHFNNHITHLLLLVIK